jgi:TPR repeat protein
MQLPRNEQEAHNRLVRLAQAGHSNAQYCLGCKYKNGEFVRKNPTLAIEWFEKASEGGSILARTALGDMYCMGTGVATSYSEARYCYELAPNNAVALDGLGHLYQDGKGVSQNEETAMELFQKSAELGYPPGLSNFGTLLYEQGRIEEALVQFEKGARLEQYLGGYRDPIVYCQKYTAICLANVYQQDMDGGNPDKDPFPLVLFWARRALMNGDDGAFLKPIELFAHSKCRHCGKPNPQMKCSGCRAVSYCNKVKSLHYAFIPG